jgi:hypothetical protein
MNGEGQIDISIKRLMMHVAITTIISVAAGIVIGWAILWGLGVVK